MKKYNVIDLFSGCGGLLDGFLQTGRFEHIASVEWEKAPLNTLRNRLEKKWGYVNHQSSVIHFDIQRFEELIGGYDDIKYGLHVGLDAVIGNKLVDLIIGGPPCQSYSVAGRIRDRDQMKFDYRNYLFEYYLKIVNHYRPKYFLFENVPGMLSSMPDGTPIIDLIKRDVNKINYKIVDDARSRAILNASDFGVPQNRKRVILLGVNEEYFSNTEWNINQFYDEILQSLKFEGKTKTVFDAIGDLPPCFPLFAETRPSHTVPKIDISWHIPRFSSVRDTRIFQLLAHDIESGKSEFSDSARLIDIYNEATGKNTNVHKYHVLRKDLPSTTILAHLYKDGLRFIHYDSSQARTITVREAARLQSFDDDFEFIGSMGDAYKMIGNAVPPLFARNLAEGLIHLFDTFESK